MRSWTTMVPFFLVALTVVGGVHYYLYVRLVRAAALPPTYARALGIVFLALAVLTPVGIFLARSLPRPTSTIIGVAIYSWFGLAMLLFVLSLGSEFIRAGADILRRVGVLPDDPGRRQFLARVLSAGVASGGVVLGLYGVSVARGKVAVKKVDVALKRLPKQLDGFKIVQISDVHLGPTLGHDFMKEVVDSINALEPDLVAITGDLVDGSVRELEAHVAPLADIRAKHGVFFVTGNHEYYAGADDWLAHLPTLGVRPLRNERVEIGDGEATFDLAGVDDWRAKGFGGDHGADLPRALQDRDESRELVLLAHQPKQASEAARLGVGLQLSGHTHGGQIFPWGLFVKLDQPFLAGLDRVGDFQIYTSCGTGYWGPPMRVGAPSEISMIVLRRDASSDGAA
jgi:predicted MPP superfamily phosphohydrolase